MGIGMESGCGVGLGLSMGSWVVELTDLAVESGCGVTWGLAVASGRWVVRLWGLAVGSCWRVGLCGWIASSWGWS